MLRTLSFAERDQFRAALTAAGYTATGVTGLLGSLEAPSERKASFARMLYTTRHGSPLDICVRLFLNSVPVQVEDVRRALEPFALESLVATGLVTLEGDTVSPAVTLMPMDDVYLVFDIPLQLSVGAKADHVVGVSFSGMHVANAMIRRRSHKTLDVGSGCGNLAFTAAPFSEQVYGVDSNPRSVNFAGFGAWLNGLDHVRFLEGDAFQPVSGQEFDLICANLPFVIAPSFEYQYRDGGMRADLFSRRIVREAPAALAPGGFAQFLCQWAHVREKNWRDRLSEWFQESACDVLVLRIEESDVSNYAERWIGDTEPSSTAASGEVFAHWMSYYEAEGIEAVSSGIITMRRSDAATHWLRIQEMPRSFDAPYGDALLRLFRLTDLAERAPDPVLLDQRLRAAPDMRLIQTNAPGDRKWKPLGAEIRLTDGLHYDGNVDPLVANLITLCNGTRTGAAAIEILATELKVSPERLMERCLAVIRDLVSRGFLLPPEEALF